MPPLSPVDAAEEVFAKRRWPTEREGDLDDEVDCITARPFDSDKTGDGATINVYPSIGDEGEEHVQVTCEIFFDEAPERLSPRQENHIHRMAKRMSDASADGSVYFTPEVGTIGICSVIYMKGLSKEAFQLLLERKVDHLLQLSLMAGQVFSEALERRFVKKDLIKLAFGDPSGLA
jgi:hypothetical protein